MARLNTSQIVVKVSKLQRDNEEDSVLLTADTLVQLEAIISELVGSSVMVEIDSNNE